MEKEIGKSMEFNNFKIEHLHKLQHLFNEFFPNKEIKIQL